MGGGGSKSSSSGKVEVYVQRASAAEAQSDKVKQQLQFIFSREGVKEELQRTLAEKIGREWMRESETNLVTKESGLVMSYANLEASEVSNIVNELMSAMGNIKNRAVLGGMRSLCEAAMKVVTGNSKIDEMIREDYDRLQFKDGDKAYRIQYAVAYKYLKITDKGGFLKDATSTTKVGLYYRVQCDSIAFHDAYKTFAQIVKMGLASDVAVDYAKAIAYQNMEPRKWDDKDYGSFLESFNKDKYLTQLMECDLDPSTVFDAATDDEDIREAIMDPDVPISKIAKKKILAQVLRVRSCYMTRGRGWFQMFLTEK